MKARHKRKPKTKPPPRPVRALATDPSILAGQLRARMKQLGLTRYEVAKRAGLFQSAIHRTLSGKIKSPELATLARIADALGLTVALVAKRRTPPWFAK